MPPANDMQMKTRACEARSDAVLQKVLNLPDGNCKESEIKGSLPGNTFCLGW